MKKCLVTTLAALMLCAALGAPVCAYVLPGGAYLGARAHVENLGWLGWTEGVGGTTGQTLALEALEFNPYLGAGSRLLASAHLAETGWSALRAGACGTTGESRTLQALRLIIEGPDAARYTVWYRAHVRYYGWLDWAADGQSAGSTGMNLPAEAVEAVIYPKGHAAPGDTLCPEITPNMTPRFGGSAHSSTIGWQSGQDGLFGTTGQALPLEALALNLKDEKGSGIEVMSQLAETGWETDYRPGGTVSGTTGQSRPIETVRIRLTGPAAEAYDVYYQIHAATLGWLGWAKNGEPAGTEGRALAAEAVRVRLIKKEEPGPQADAPAYLGPETETE